VSIIFWCFSIF